jgi:methylmalonyl-CoA/ethylmalonyl-CoA epimerase
MDTKNLPLNISNADQVGIIVDDLDGTLQQFKLLLGIDNFDVVDWPKPGTNPESTYYGKPASFKLKIGFANLGNLQLEVLKPMGGKSIFSDFLETHGPGLHHIRFTEKDFPQKVDQLQKAGIQMICSGRGIRSSSTWAYFDTTRLLGGIYIELRTAL